MAWLHIRPVWPVSPCIFWLHYMYVLTKYIVQYEPWLDQTFLISCLSKPKSYDNLYLIRYKYYFWILHTSTWDGAMVYVSWHCDHSEIATERSASLGWSVHRITLCAFYFFQGQLSLQKLWFYIQPCMRTMEILSSIAVAIDKVINLRGVLNGMYMYMNVVYYSGRYSVD